MLNPITESFFGLHVEKYIAMVFTFKGTLPLF